MQKTGRKASFAVAAAVAVLFAARTARAEPPAWSVGLASFARMSQQGDRIGKIIGNQMLFVMLMTGAQQYFTSNYGSFNAGRPFAFHAFRTHDGRTLDVALVYPGNDKVAGMVLHNPGAEKTPSGGVCLKPGRLYASFDRESGLCAFATTEERAKEALAASAPVVPEDGLAVCSWYGGTVAFRVDDKGLFTDTKLRPGAKSRSPAGIPVLSALAGKGGTNRIHRVDFADVKAAVLELAKNTFGHGGGAL